MKIQANYKYMAFTFIEIEQRKTRTIKYIFAFLIVFYFFVAYCIALVLKNTLLFEFCSSSKCISGWLSLRATIYTFLISFAIGAYHWYSSTSNLIEKISTLVGAVKTDRADTYHHYLKDIVDEVSVAIGGRNIQAMVIRDASLNAFALEDFNANAVIGVTEGLLARFNRSQIEAVVAHEASHIANGDCLSVSISCAIAEVHEEALSKIEESLKNSKRNAPLFLVAIFAILALTNFLAKLMRLFISRQREYRADATAVRLTRDPLALAEGLKLISRNWHGAGIQGERLESIFIINPRFSFLDEREGVFADMFSTHPPVSKRIGILLDMAHLDMNTLDEKLKNFHRVSPVSAMESAPGDMKNKLKKWLIMSTGRWVGPFGIEELKSMPNFHFDDWVKQEGASSIIYAYDDSDLREILSGKARAQGEQQKLSCPHCRSGLTDMNYEGAPVLRCLSCGGTFVGNDKVSRILIRGDAVFNEDITRIGQALMDSKGRFKIPQDAGGGNAWIIRCPRCQRKMHRHFFVDSYPVEVDSCIYCSGIWFDKQELEILQYLYEHKEKLFK